MGKIKTTNKKANKLPQRLAASGDQHPGSPGGRSQACREPGGATLGDVPKMEIADRAGKALMEATRHAGR